MQCAQCHHHPFERWSQNDYYALSAFFSQVGRKPTAIAGEDLIFHKRGVAEVENKKTLEKVKPAALGQTPVEISPDDDPRLQLADWMSEPTNPFFAKALVNRYWKHFFKRGLVEPEDDIRDTNPATNPELLDALAKHFVESGFDLKEAVRVIVQSQTYQLSAMPNEQNAVDSQNFSHFYPKRMTAEARYRVADAILRHCPVVVVVSASSATIDRDGLHVTNQRLLREVAHRLAPHADVCLVDGRPVPEPMPAHIPLVGGDGTSAAVAAASVVAKTARDRMMRGPACAAYPDYGFGAHVGYATATHRAAVRTHGPCPLHRRSFASLAYAPWPGDAGPGGGDGDG